MPMTMYVVVKLPWPLVSTGAQVPSAPTSQKAVPFAQVGATGLPSLRVKRKRSPLAALPSQLWFAMPGCRSGWIGAPASPPQETSATVATTAALRAAPQV